MRMVIATGMPTNAMAAKRKPTSVATWSGVWEKETIASSAKRTILRSGYLVSPA